MRISRWSRSVAAGTGGVVIAALATTAAAQESTAGPGGPRPGPDATPGGVSASAPPRSGAGWTAEDAEDFWTAGRMESATPPPAAEAPAPGSAQPGGTAKTKTRAGTTATAPRARAAAATPSATSYKGARTIGVLYYVDSGMTAHSCTASVVHSPKGNLILTAGHCGPGKKHAFVPQYRTGKPAAQQPYGIWAVDRFFKDPRHTDTGPGSDLDFGFATLKPDKNGRPVERLTGANTLTRTPNYRVPVTVIGYPKAKYDPRDRAIKCRTTTSRLPGYKQLRMKCAGFHGGTSGSPWLMNFDERTQRGQVVGNLGGAGGGGSSSDISYAPFYDDQVFKLYDDAVADVAEVERPPLPYALGTGETWQHAKKLASGDYTGDGKADLLAVWASGEVTLHTGDGNGGFSAQRRLKAPNGTWKHAAAITGGDFAGTGRSDLFVRWSDGEVTLYPDVSAAGFGREVRLAKARSTWKHATQITAGRFSGNKRADDLVVRWSDGELTLYREAGDGFKKETRLQKPNATWKRAALLVGGDFTGGDRGDVLVRWSDGKLTLHQDVGTGGLGRKTQLRGASALWKHAKVATAGGYTAGGRPDDIVVRWSDGEVSLYADTTTRLGTERNLVPPRTT
ncbi:FG-GAP-like repeat-containing protein [Streptomyces spectabilis]|uniref:trypsin-like serine peptidase n=1 Tax=Streptomyces spectabilis TaxID=68270 RepID=UPI0033DA2846